MRVSRGPALPGPFVTRCLDTRGPDSSSNRVFGVRTTTTPTSSAATTPLTETLALEGEPSLEQQLSGSATSG